jgi:hypothetical protein
VPHISHTIVAGYVVMMYPEKAMEGQAWRAGSNISDFASIPLQNNVVLNDNVASVEVR